MLRGILHRRSSSAPPLFQPAETEHRRESIDSLASQRNLHMLMPHSPVGTGQSSSDSMPAAPTLAAAHVAKKALLHAAYIAKGKPETPALSSTPEATRYAQRYLAQLQDDADLTLDVGQTWRRIALAMATALHEISLAAGVAATAATTSDFSSSGRSTFLADGFDPLGAPLPAGKRASVHQRSIVSASSQSPSQSQSQFLRPCIMPASMHKRSAASSPLRAADPSRRGSNMRLASGVLGVSTGEYIAFRASPTALLAKADVGEEEDDGTFTVNQHVILMRLGRGTQGEVFLAMDTVANELRAIKAVRRPKVPRHAFGVGALMFLQAQRGQLEREISVMKQCRHPNVVSLYEVIDDPAVDTMYLVIQYVEKGPIATVSDAGTIDAPLNPGKLAEYTVQLCSGLQYLHKKGVIHRDIKPDNILIGNHDDVYLADFGMADLFDGDGSKKAVEGHRGTFAFMAPELLMEVTGGAPIRGEPVDVWALGVTLFVLLFGKLPWSMESRLAMQDDIVACNIHDPNARSPRRAMVNQDHDDDDDDETFSPGDLPPDVPVALEATIGAAPSFVRNRHMTPPRDAPAPLGAVPPAQQGVSLDAASRGGAPTHDDSESDSDSESGRVAGAPQSSNTNCAPFVAHCPCVPTPPRQGSALIPHQFAPRPERLVVTSSQVAVMNLQNGGPQPLTPKGEPQTVMSEWMKLLRRAMAKSPADRATPAELAAMARQIIDVASVAEHHDCEGRPTDPERDDEPVITRRRGALFE